MAEEEDQPSAALLPSVNAPFIMNTSIASQGKEAVRCHSNLSEWLRESSTSNFYSSTSLTSSIKYQGDSFCFYVLLCQAEASSLKRLYSHF